MMTDLMKKLINRLIDQTKKDLLKWEQTALQNQFVIVIGDNAICLSNDNECISMSVMKKDGEEAVKVVVTPTDEDYKMFEQLYQIIQLKNENNQKMLEKILQVMNTKSNQVNYNEIDEK